MQNVDNRFCFCNYENLLNYGNGIALVCSGVKKPIVDILPIPWRKLKKKMSFRRIIGIFLRKTLIFATSKHVVMEYRKSIVGREHEQGDAPDMLSTIYIERDTMLFEQSWIGLGKAADT